jgi:hypothetical protein
MSALDLQCAAELAGLACVAAGFAALIGALVIRSGLFD